MKRDQIINEIIEKQKAVIQNLLATIKEYRTAADMDEESTHDAEDYSHVSQAKDMQLRYEKMLAEAEQNLAFLEIEKKMSHPEIENGAVIETDKNILFVGIAVPAFQLGDKDVISFSEEAPIFGKLKRKKVGETVKIGDKTHEILAFG